MGSWHMPASYSQEGLRAVDPEVADAIEGELGRQEEGLELIASENYAPPEVMWAQGSVLTNKYAEGLPGARYYGGCEFVDVVEELARERAKGLFGAEHANVQPHSGAQANTAVYFGGARTRGRGAGDGPMHVIAAKAAALKLAMTEGFRQYQRQVVRSAAVLAETLAGEGFRLVSGGTDNHLILVDVGARGMTGKQAERMLGEAGITVNKNTIPFDTRPAMTASGIRIGTPAVTTRGMKETEMRTIGRLIADVLLGRTRVQAVREEARALCSAYPMH